VDRHTDASHEEAMRRRTALAAMAAIALGTALSCVPPAPAPMRTIQDAYAGPRARTLVVFLPGRSDRAEEFVRERFAAEVRARSLPVDLVFADATLGYYVDRSFLTRLHDDVLAPARARGYDHVVLAGISLGGLGAVLYARAHPDEIDELILLAPYLEDPRISPPGAVADATSGRTTWLGYGNDDRLRASLDPIAATLPRGRVVTRPGGHGWGTWRAVWIAMLDAGALPR
jgi:pimeloyl-ACP methyl ester carboxylesterase